LEQGEIIMAVPKARTLTRELSPHIILTSRDFEQLSMLTRAAGKKISVLAPVGTSLIGVRAGDSITWKTRTGTLRSCLSFESASPSSAEVRTIRTTPRRPSVHVDSRIPACSVED
jgi:hypothetical protein